MTYSIAFHSYKGGTGKTTIASNLSAFLAKKGYKVCLLDLDIYAPSLQTYFEITPKKWINDYLYSDAKFEDVITDLSPLISQAMESSIPNGKLYVGLCASNKEDFIRLEGGNSDFRKQLFHKLIMFREKLIERYNLDYIIIDTSPGVRYWSLNALAIADVFFLTLKMGDIDIEGTKKMVSEIYHSFTEYGSKSFLIWNKVAGYCMPQPYKKEEEEEEEGWKGNENSRSRESSFTGSNTNADNYSLLLSSVEKKQRQIQVQDQKKEQIDTEDRLSDKVGMKVISTIPCYCDIQFSKKEYLTAIHVPHPFSEKIESLVNSIQQELVDRDSE